MTFELENDKYVDVKYTANEFDNSCFKGSIVGLSGSNDYDAEYGNLKRNYVGRGYAKITKDDETIVVYADYNNSDIANNTRSISYVAYMLRNDANASDVYNAYKQNIDKFANLYIE